jgi:hypothetical protein
LAAVIGHLRDDVLRAVHGDAGGVERQLSDLIDAEFLIPGRGRADPFTPLSIPAAEVIYENLLRVRRVGYGRVARAIDSPGVRRGEREALLAYHLRRPATRHARCLFAAGTQARAAASSGPVLLPRSIASYLEQHGGRRTYKKACSSATSARR